MAKKTFLTKNDRAALVAARRVLRKVSRRAIALNAVRRKCDAVEPAERDAANGMKWKKASMELWSLMDEAETAGIAIPPSWDEEKGMYSLRERPLRKGETAETAAA